MQHCQTVAPRNLSLLTEQNQNNAAFKGNKLANQLTMLNPKSAVLCLSTSEAWRNPSLLQASCFEHLCLQCFLCFVAPWYCQQLPAGCRFSQLQQRARHKLWRKATAWCGECLGRSEDPGKASGVRPECGCHSSLHRYCNVYHGNTAPLTASNCSLLSNVVQQRQALLQLNLQGSPVEAPFCFFQF